MRTGLAGGPDEAYFGDGAAALIIGDETDGPVVAELGSWVSLTDEFVDRWRRPNEERSRVWEERFGEVRYGALGNEALNRLFKSTGIGPDDVDRLIVTGTHSRACRAVVQRSGVPTERLVDDVGATVGNTGAAHPFMLLSSALDGADPEQTIVLLVLADGAEALVVRTTPDVARHRVRRVVGPPDRGWSADLLRAVPRLAGTPAGRAATAAGAGPDVFVGRRPLRPLEVRLRGLPVDRRDRPSAASARRRGAPTHGGGPRHRDHLHHRPALLHAEPAAGVRRGRLRGRWSAAGRVDRRRRGGRPRRRRVEMTFRRLSTADGIHNYFWKARPYRKGDH